MPLTQECPKRLLVLVPGGDVCEPELARQAWALARRHRSEVMFLGLVEEAHAEALMRRRLAHLAAMTRAGEVLATSRLAWGHHWLHAIESVRQPWDLIVCAFEEQASVGRWGVRRMALSRQLALKLKAPVELMAGTMPLRTARGLRRERGWLAIATTLAMIVGCFWLQVRISQLPSEAIRTGLLGLSVIVEFGLITVLNRP